MSNEIIALQREYKLYRNRWRRRKSKVLALSSNKYLTKYWGYAVIEGLVNRALFICDEKIEYYETKLKQLGP